MINSCKNKSHQCNQHRCDSNNKHDTTMPTPAKTIKPLSAKDQARFQLNVIIGENPTDCHDWKLGKISRGYGVFWLRGKQSRASRVAYTIAFGEIPDGMFVCHKCDNPSCVNPLHLFLGSTEENMSDMKSKGRQMRGDNHYARTNPERLARGERHGTKTHPEKIRKGDNHFSRTNPEKMARGEKHGSKTKPWKVAKGNKNGNSKLTESQVLEIRSMREISQSCLAKIYKVAVPTIGDILHRITWKHI
jgi:hypothetical protein